MNFPPVLLWGLSSGRPTSTRAFPAARGALMLVGALLMALTPGCGHRRPLPSPEVPVLSPEGMKVFRLPKALISNPSGLAFAGRLEDGRVRLYTVCDGSAMVKDHFDPRKLVLELIVDTTGARDVEVRALDLDPASGPCDLEGIEVNPVDGTLLVADERVAGLAECGGTVAFPGAGPSVPLAAQTRFFQLDTTGKLLGGPWPVDLYNTDNNGIEALAARTEADGVHVYLFKEWEKNGCPFVLDYRMPGNGSASPEKIDRFELGCGWTQTAADFHKPTGDLMVVDRDVLLLSVYSLDAWRKAEPPQRTKKLELSLDAVMEAATGLEYNTSRKRELRKGMVEGMTSDEKGGVYLMLDNNGDAFADGDRAPRMIWLEKLKQK